VWKVRYEDLQNWPEHPRPPLHDAQEREWAWVCLQGGWRYKMSLRNKTAWGPSTFNLGVLRAFVCLGNTNSPSRIKQK